MYRPLTSLGPDEISNLIQAARKTYEDAAEQYKNLSADDKEWLRFICAAIAVNSWTIRDRTK